MILKYWKKPVYGDRTRRKSRIMAHIKVNKKEFDQLIGTQTSEDYLKEEASFLGVHWNPEEEEKWDVEVYPNRPDLLSVEGLARAYKGFKGIETGKTEYSPSIAEIEVEVDDSVDDVRPFIGGAVVRDLELDQRTINGLIQLQEKLHETMGRKRDKLAIGLHDLQNIEPPFTYKAVKPGKVSFKPLQYDREMGLGEIVEKHEKGQEYGWILDEEEKYPVIEDSENKVLSFPPIINNQLTEVETETTDIFIDVTGKDRQTVKKALNIIVTALAERGGEIEKVIVDGKEMPDLSHDEMLLDPDYLRDVSGLDLDDGEIVERLERMKYGAEKTKKGVRVEVPPYRNDIMHSYDLIEDAVIAHGYHNIDPEVPEVFQEGEQKIIEDYTDLLRDILQGTAALEAHTYILSSREKLETRMEMKGQEIAEMNNPLTEDYSAVRNWLLPSMLATLKRNRHQSYPQRFFEVADVVKLDESATGASNRRKAAYVIAGGETDFNDSREVLQVIERDLGINLEVREKTINCFEKGRSAAVYMDDEKVGIVGEFSQQVRQNWGLEIPVSGLELDFWKIKEKITG